MEIASTLFTLALLIFCQPALSGNYLRTSPDSCHKPPAEQPLSQVLPCYLNQPDNAYSWALLQSETLPDETIIHTMQLQSQRWDAGEEQSVDHPVWQHRVNVFIPKNIIHTTALLYINGGTLYPEQKAPEPNNKDVDFSRIAARTQSVVINLKDVPNQFLTFMDSSALKEDDLIAYTWERFMDDPVANRQWPLRLPMVKSAVRAMDMIQEFTQSRHVRITNFVVSGGSKRGWAAWLTAAMDQRVTAIVPMVIDVLNLRPSMHHHFAAYGRWAPAIKSYCGLMHRLDSPEMDQLLTVVDPISYKNQLSMPKYLITASADDFFLPDSSQFYFSDLPGNKWMNVLPNLRHYIVRSQSELVTNTLESFHGAFIEERPMPKISWETSEDLLIVRSSSPPKEAWLWRAYNPSARDFRVTPDNPDIQQFQAEPVKFHCKENCRFTLNLKHQTKGWAAYFVELKFSNSPYSELTFTTRVFVSPDNYPSNKISNILPKD